MPQVRWVYHSIHSNVAIRYLLYSALLIIVIISVEILIQEVHEPGKYLYHRSDPYLLKEIALASDARKPSATPVVPRIVHYVWSDTPYMRFHHMICMLSTYHFIKPDKIIIWYSVSKPSGQWWDYLMRNVSSPDKFELRFHDDPKEIFGRRIRIAEHKSDVVRLEAIKNIGGIYLDTDVVTFKSFDHLLYHDVTMGLEDENALCNGVIIARPNATFVKIWWEEYHTFNDGQWGQHSVYLPALLASIYPYLCFVLPTQFHRPNWRKSELTYIYGDKKYEWQSKNYAMHLWFRFYNVEHDLYSIKNLKSTFGEICRFIIYGQTELVT